MASSESALVAQVPALEPPPGVTPDFNTLYSGLQPLFIAIISLYLMISTFVVGARLVAKGLDARLIQVEDCLLYICLYKCLANSLIDIVFLAWVSSAFCLLNGYRLWLTMASWVSRDGVGSI